MRRPTDGEREVTAELNRDADPAVPALADEPDAILSGACPGRAATPATSPSDPDDDDDDDDDDDEHSLSPSDCWDVGYVDGLYTLAKRPPLDDTLGGFYRSGYAAGASEAEAHAWRKEAHDLMDAERAAWNLPPFDTDDIPF